MALSERFRPGLNGHLKAKAAALLSQAIATGKLNRPSICEECGKMPVKPLHGHHEDYERPLDVVWLCCRCHHRRHYIAHTESVVRVAVALDPELAHAFRYRCVVEDRTQSSVMTQALTEYLNMLAAQEATA